VPKYDFRCDECGHLFELTRSFGQSGEPACCPRDGSDATRLFSPPLDLLMYRRESVVDTGPVRIPPGALSCHDHGPSPGAAPVSHGEQGRHAGSAWHARGYGDAADDAPATHGHSHGRHSHTH
jgi:putative FmdB family regulatory protein